MTTPRSFFRKTKNGYVRSKRVTLWESFLLYLHSNKIQKFTTAVAYNFYKLNKRGRGHPDYSAVYPNILNPLRHRELITQKEQGVWDVVRNNATLKVEELLLKTTGELHPFDLNPEEKGIEQSEESLTESDKEFFDYIETKTKGGV